MSSYSLSNSAPINNIGYYDVPIYNQYSNQQQNRPYRQITNHQFNNQVSDSYNNENYEIYQSQSYPSPSLFIEQDASMSGYGYTNNNGQYNGAMIQKKQFNRRNIPHPSEVYAIENFENEDPNMELQQNANRLDNMKKHKENPIQNIQRPNHQHYNQRPNQENAYQRPPSVINNYVPTQPNIYHNDYHYNNTPNYLNVGSMPNIAGLYDNPHNRPIEKIIIKETDNRDTVVTNLDDDSDNDDDDDNSRETKIDTLKKKVNKKVKRKKKKDNMIYLIIFLLVIIIGLMLYIVMNGKVKKVRF